MTIYDLRFTNEGASTSRAARRPLSVTRLPLSVSLMILLLLPLISCGQSKARKRLAQDECFIEILKRESRRSIGQDEFFENSLLKDADPEVRQWSAIALGRIGSPRALPLLYQSLRTGDADLRAASAFAVGQIEGRGFSREIASVPDPEAVAELARALDGPSVIVRTRAVEALGKTGAHSAAAEIVSRLNQSPLLVTPARRAYLQASITALGRIGDPGARPVIEKIAETGDVEIRKRALEALVRIGSRAPDPPETAPGLQRDFPRPTMGSITDAFWRVLAANRKNSTIARLETNRGAIEIELFREDAPATVASFVLRADGGDYAGMKFERIIPHELIEGKSLKTLSGNIRAIPGEVNMRPFERGSLGMGWINGDSETGCFFIALTPQPYLDGRNTCFGRVISGMPVADRIVPGDTIRQVVITETISFMDYQGY